MKFGDPLAALVYDGRFHLPPTMGTPAPGQLQGTIGERLSELAGRICYDSLGGGRSSPDYHTHILEVGHGSVYEHYHLSVDITVAESFKWRMLGALIGRPGVWVREVSDLTTRVTLNIRAAIEWDQWKPQFSGLGEVDDFLYTVLVGSMSSCAPMAVRTFDKRQELDWNRIVSLPDQSQLNDDELWISVLLYGSRGFTHEQVRHGDFTAISQRSTRYVDESESDWVLHPLIKLFWWEQPAGSNPLGNDTKDLIESSRALYRQWVSTLQPWLIARGVDKGTARKQARGAARGFLGNALGSDMIFSASVAQWKRMFKLRAAAPADGEIRVVYNRVFEELRRSSHKHRFDDIVMTPSGDGIGEVLVE